jgi:hypothetical protein
MAIGISIDRAAQALLGKQDQNLMDSAVSAGASQELLGSMFNALSGPNVNYDLQSGNLTTRGPQRQGTVLREPDNRAIINQTMSQAGVPQLDQQILGAMQEEQRRAAFNQSVDAARDALNRSYDDEIVSGFGETLGIPNQQQFLSNIQAMAPQAEPKVEPIPQAGRGTTQVLDFGFFGGDPNRVGRGSSGSFGVRPRSRATTPNATPNSVEPISPTESVETSPSALEPVDSQATQTTSEFLAQRDIPTTQPQLPEGVQPGSPQANFLSMQASGQQMTPEQIRQAEQFASSIGTTFDPQTGYSRDPFLSRQASLMGRPMEGQSLSQFMRYEDQPIQRTEQFVEPGTGRIRRRATEAAVDLMRQDGFDIPQGVRPLAPEYAGFEQDAALRRGRMDARPDFMVAQPSESQMGDKYSSSVLRDAFGGGDALKQAKALQRAGFDPFTQEPITSEGAGEIFQAGGKLLVRDPDGKTRSLGDVSDGLSPSEEIALKRFDFDVAKFNYEQQKDKLEADELAAASKATSIFQVKDLLRQNELITRAVDQAGNDIGFGTVGLTGALISFVPGTKAFDQKSVIETLEADAAFGALQAMRESNEQGSALGSVTERELALLAASRGSLRQGQTNERFRENLENYLNLRNQMLVNVYDGFTQQYGSTAANEAFGVTSRNQLMAPTAGEQQPAGVDTLSDDVDIKITGRNN